MTGALQAVGIEMQKPKRETSLQIRLTWEEAEDFRRAAELEGMQLSAWGRQLMRDGARKVLAKIGETPSFNGKAR